MRLQDYNMNYILEIDNITRKHTEYSKQYGMKQTRDSNEMRKKKKT
jgi:hypothetical protein